MVMSTMLYLLSCAIPLFKSWWVIILIVPFLSHKIDAVTDILLNSVHRWYLLYVGTLIHWRVEREHLTSQEWAMMRSHWMSTATLMPESSPKMDHSSETIIPSSGIVSEPTCMHSSPQWCIRFHLSSVTVDFWWVMHDKDWHVVELSVISCI